MVAVTTTEQDSWPPRVLVSVTGLTITDVVTIYRQVDGYRYPVRGAQDVEATDTTMLRIDAELPFSASITYVAVVDDTTEYEADPIIVTLPGGNVVLSDAITGEAAEVEILEWPEKKRTRRNTVFAVGGRNIAVMGLRSGWVGTVVLETDTDTGRESLQSLLDTATSGILQIRQPGGYEGVDCYVAVLSDSESRRDTSDGADQRRIWELECVEVEPWASTLEATGWTLLDLANAYDGLTLADLEADYSTLLELAQAELGV